MTANTDVHTCSYYCERPECVKAQRDELRKALKELITWVPSADTYRRLGLDPVAPMRAYEAAKAALAKENGSLEGER